jgi:asparagine synthase (glutamine-hydrolysing)
MIMAWARGLPGSLQCYTFAGTYRECADVRIARKLAQLCHQPHQTIVAGPDLLQNFPSLAEQAIHLSDGTMDVTGAVELYVNRKARQIAPLRVTGNYGSEIVRGNVAFRPRRVPESALRPEVARATRAAADTYVRERACHPVTFIAFKQVPWHHYARLSVEQSQLTLRSPYLDNDLVSLMYRVPPALVTSREPSLRLCFEGNPALDAIGTDRGLRYRHRPVIDRLAHAAIKFTVKAEYAYDYGMPQWLARLDHRLAALHLERLFLGRQKFYHFRVWYRDALAGYLKAVLLDPNTLARSPYDPSSLRVMVESHIAGRANFTLDLHRALGVELTYRQLIDRWG